MTYQEEYESKRRTADEIAAMVKSGDVIDYGTCTCTVIDIDNALAKRIPELYDIDVYSGITVRMPSIVQVPDAKEHMTWTSRHWTGIDRKIAQQGFTYFMPERYSELPRYCLENMERLDFVFLQVAPMDANGCFNFGPTASHTAALAQRADKVVVEVNKNMPICLGGSGVDIHISDVDYIVEGSNTPLAAIPSGAPSEVDKTVARMIMNEIHDGACLQLGIGGMPNTVGAMLCESDLKDLGVHTEMYVDAYVDLAMAGKVTCQKKTIDKGRQVFAFAAGTQKLYDYLDNNPACMAAPISYTNDIRTVAAIDNFVSINNAVDVDLYGQVTGETAGIRQISGAGGQQDFVLGAYLSKGGKSFICLSSTFKNKDGSLASRIRPTLQPGSVVTDTRVNTMYVVTEYGCVCLKGLSVWERAEKLISVAHPQFREELIREAEKQKIWYPHNRR